MKQINGTIDSHSIDFNNVNKPIHTKLSVGNKSKDH